ncbi:MAG: hypothetical protein K0Q51_467 [Rickettsiaceae bacterium]|jgi:hypothetical protein|nr:hypothetical protein [Rickettsiaceae bacterium]
MKYISLIDTRNQNIITIDAESLIIKLEISGTFYETRIKPYMASVLYELFSKHPNPVSYEEIIDILKNHGLTITDFTRMHRKLSEIRQFIQKAHPSLESLIYNTRGHGYSLSLRLKNLYQIGSKPDNIEFTNIRITKAVEILETLINDSIDLTSQTKIIKHSKGFCLNRDPIKHILVEKIITFKECEQTILKEIRIHEADFNALRINYLLAKLKTYIGLARISEYPISEAQWLDWFTQESWTLFDEIKKFIRFAECL